MENATKALLIAASVLIAIALIAIGIRILSSTSGVTRQVDRVSSDLETSIYNSQFTKYAGEQKGYDVKALLRLVKQSNISGNKETISVYYTAGGANETGGFTTPDGIDYFSDTLASNDIYPVEIRINNDTGLVNKVVVTVH